MDMTREDAREILTHNWTRVDNPNYSESKLDEAFFMAIEALSATNDVVETDDEVIEQNALMSHEEAWEQIDKENNSADSLQVTGKLKKPCDSLLTDDSEDSKEQKSKLDLISRAEVITTLKTIPYDEEMWADVQDSLIYQINDIPSVSAERVGVWEHKPSKSGEWIWWQCSKCGAVIYSESEADRKIHHAYCGVCGARMENKK